MPKGQAKQRKSVESLTHEEARRRNLPSAEHQPLMREEEQTPVRVAYERRNRDLDPQLVWRGKDEQDWSDLVVNAPPLYIQERVHPKALIDDLMRRSRNGHKPDEYQTDMFADFNGLPSEDAKTEFYQHDANWSNRMILGDSLQVMASLAEREGLRGKVQCIYIDPPYGIRFNSNFQWSTTSRDVRDGNREHITREPEQVKAFRDTWRDGVHSYLTYLRDRLTVARDLLTDSGSIFVQIGDENVHRVRALMDELFGDENFCSQISFVKTSGMSTLLLSNVSDFILWYAKDKTSCKYRQMFSRKVLGQEGTTQYVMAEDTRTLSVRRLMKEERTNGSIIPNEMKILSIGDVRSQGATSERRPVKFEGHVYELPHNSHWKTSFDGMQNLVKANRLLSVGNTLMYKRYMDDYPVFPGHNIWLDTVITGYSDDKPESTEGRPWGQPLKKPAGAPLNLG